MRDDIRYQHVHTVNKHLANDLFGNVEGPKKLVWGSERYVIWKLRPRRTRFAMDALESLYVAYTRAMIRQGYP